MTDTKTMTHTQDFTQTEHYRSESKGTLVPIKTMPIPYALRALNRVAVDFGMEHLQLPLCKALAERVAKAGETTNIEIAPGLYMMVDPVTRRFTGAYASTKKVA